jgi:hypothetical protein
MTMMTMMTMITTGMVGRSDDAGGEHAPMRAR